MESFSGLTFTVFFSIGAGAFAYACGMPFKNIFYKVAFQAFALKILWATFFKTYGRMSTSTPTPEAFKSLENLTLDLISIIDKALIVIGIIALTIGLIGTAYRMYKKHEFTIKQTLRKFRR